MSDTPTEPTPEEPTPEEPTPEEPTPEEPTPGEPTPDPLPIDQPVAAIIRRLAYTSSPLDDTELSLAVSYEDQIAVDYMTVECGGVGAGRLLVAQMSIGLAEPAGDSGFWRFLAYASDGNGPGVLKGEYLFPITGSPFKPDCSFAIPITEEYTNLTVWIETTLSANTGVLRVSGFEAERMHSFFGILDYGPLNNFETPGPTEEPPVEEPPVEEPPVEEPPAEEPPA